MKEEMQKLQFETNYHKTLEAMLYVLSRRDSVNIYNLMKVMFGADKYHLNTYGRPVTGDTYIKMPYGTVPSTTYDMVKNDPLPLAALSLESYPFEKKSNQLTANRPPNLEYLSASDIEALEHGISEYMDLSFSEVQNKNHQEKCWINSDMNSPIDFALMIENPEVLRELQENPLRLVI